MNHSLHRWIKIALFNLLIVAAIGVILRYKILFSLPFIDQKHLLHGHSHFAFAGWISQALMALLVHNLSLQSGKNVFSRYKWLLWANLLTAYGMLIAFPVQGYGLYSILFSTLSIFVSYVFAFLFWKDLNRLKKTSLSHLWYKASLLFNAISSMGAFALAYMMGNKVIHQNWYLGAVYFFLHFQYNGWFFFAGMGLLYKNLEINIHDQKRLKQVFWCFVLACIPAYFLSALWMPIPIWIYTCVVAAAFLQIVGWVLLLRLIFSNHIIVYSSLPSLIKYLFCLAALALTAKLLLQLGSTIPALSQLAFGFRPIVIGYLHLVLLGVITIFLIGYIFSLGIFLIKNITLAGCIIFTGGIIFNELVLMTQGVAALSYTSIKYINAILLCIAIILLLGIGLINAGLFSKQINKNPD